MNLNINFKIKYIYIFFFLILSLNFNISQAKSPPPGTGTADVPANILLMLDNSGSMSWDINGNERYAKNLDFRPTYIRQYNGRIYALGTKIKDRRIFVLDSNGNKIKELFTGRPWSCNGIDFAMRFDIYDDKIYLSDADRSLIKILDINTGKCEQIYARYNSPYINYSIAVSNQSIFALRASGWLDIYDRNTKAFVRSYFNTNWAGARDISFNNAGTKIIIPNRDSIWPKGAVCEHTVSGFYINNTCNVIGSNYIEEMYLVLTMITMATFM
jgi:hypothetical protein